MITSNDTPRGKVAAVRVTGIRRGGVLAAAALALATACGGGPGGDAARAGAGSGIDTALGAPRFAWFNFSAGVGTAVLDTTGMLCMSSPDPALGHGERVWLVAAGATPQWVERTQVAGVSPQCAPEDDPGGRGYVLTGITEPIGENDVLIAITHPVGLPRRFGRIVAADIDGDGAVETFHACNGPDGVNLSIWSQDTTAATRPVPPGGGPPTPPGVRRWRLYHYLGTQLEPDCSAGELRSSQ
jgi:hypothetical protein